MINLEFEYRIEGLTDERFEAVMYTVLDGLLEDDCDADVRGTQTTGEIVWTVRVADEPEQGIIDNLAKVRSRLHGAGLGTPGWPTADEIFRSARIAEPDELQAV